MVGTLQFENDRINLLLLLFHENKMITEMIERSEES